MTTHQIVMGGTVAVPTSATRYYAFPGMQHSTNGTTLGSRGAPWPVSGTFSHLRVTISTALGASDVLTATVTAATVDSLAVTLNTGETTKTNTGSFSITAGQILELRYNTTGTIPGTVSWGMQFTPSVDKYFGWCANSAGDTLDNTGTCYHPIGGTGYIDNATVTNVDPVWNIDATLTQVYVSLSGSPGSGKNYTFTVMKNGSAEGSSTFSIADAATTGNVTGLTIDVAPGDKLALRSVANGTPTARLCYWGVGMQADTADQWGESGYDPTDPAGTRYETIHMGPITPADWQGSEVYWESGTAAGAQGYSVIGLRADLTTAPGAGTSRVYTLRKNSVDTSLVLTISDANTTGSVTGSVSVADTDILSVKQTITGSPAAPGNTRLGWLFQASSSDTPGVNGYQMLTLLGVGR